ncbi:glycosyltransferase family 2 protein [Terriglobus albidus]|uniref:Glycosyltransferase family 2 protein n=1 Tax=Terriglobus albidus TaxID=1592106 RepID=A0A5B9E653_9BACT|nr:glycosyltransferase family 2 protein [Terriglobus albidus]QEE27732.1 glycosyltransferase family 2 protein [Terriglobus albidus]
MSDFAVQLDLQQASNAVELAVILPTYNERANIVEAIRRTQTVLGNMPHEIIVVDDNSPDGTADVVRQLARQDSRIRLIHRIGRRGLSSAVIEGMMASTAPMLAVMDADMQHDESALPRMIEKMHREHLDLVIGTRNAHGGSMGNFARIRVRISQLSAQLSRSVCQCEVSDPMSGFFLVRDDFFRSAAPRLQTGGFKILLDLLASSDRKPRIGEIGYRFRTRMHGQSKLSFYVAVEYLFLIVNKLTGGHLCPRLTLFALTGASGLLVHFAVLAAMYLGLHSSFLTSQAVAAIAAMSTNFAVNNALQQSRLRGPRAWTGYLRFLMLCALGAIFSVSYANRLQLSHTPWALAALAGIAIGSVWNYAITQIFTWEAPQTRRAVSLSS